MPTPAQIDEQINHERDAIAQGLKRLKDNTKNLEEKSYASASIYGITTIDALLPLVVDKIKETNDRIHRGCIGVSFKEIKQYLSDIEPLAAAAIACKITIDKVFSHKEDSNQIQNICDSIGKGVENECQMRHYERHAPGLLETLKKNYWHKSIGTDQKVVVIQTLMNRYEVQQWKPWGRGNRVKLGGWLLSCIIDTSKWFEKEIRRTGRKTTSHVVPTAEFMAIKDQVMYNAELFSPLAWPMLIEPNDWTPEKPGGYLLNEIMRGHDMVRRGGSSRIQGEKPFEFLNKIQKVAYTLNPFTVKVAEILQGKGLSVGKFQPICNHELPPKPYDIAENAESRKAYRRLAAEVRNLMAQEFKKSCRTRMTMETVERFKNKEKFYIPWSFDYRGRIYPIPAFLTPQDTDWGKSLIRFADESFMDEEAERWIRFQVATTFGLDKETLDDRLSWTYRSEHEIELIATDPIANLHLWEGVEEPWQFLASCDEMYHCVIKRDRISTGLPIAIDATCSGLQILAGLAKDQSTAELVNVVPSKQPSDAYKAVAEKAKEFLPSYMHPWMTRAVCKRTVMTIPYNATKDSSRKYIREALKEANVEVQQDELTQIVNAVYNSMDCIVPGPMQVMRWIKKSVGEYIRNGGKYIEWETPSGFIVNQKRDVIETERMELQLLGRTSVRIPNGKQTPCPKRHRSSTAPNFIHSIDAAILHRSFTQFDEPFTVIHDSVLCRAGDMGTLNQLVRETYSNIFTEDCWLTKFAQTVNASEPPPIVGTLDPEVVSNSIYFFC